MLFSTLQYDTIDAARQNYQQVYLIYDSKHKILFECLNSLELRKYCDFNAGFLWLYVSVLVSIFCSRRVFLVAVLYLGFMCVS